MHPDCTSGCEPATPIDELCQLCLVVVQDPEAGLGMCDACGEREAMYVVQKGQAKFNFCHGCVGGAIQDAREV